MGVPTIGTETGGVPELITSGRDGLLVPPRNPETLACAIGELATDPARLAALSKAGRARVVDNFSSARGARTLIDALTDT